MVQQLPGISLVKSPWEGHLGKGSSAFSAGEAGGGQEMVGKLGCTHSSEQGTKQPLAGLSTSGHPCPRTQHLCFCPQGRWLNAEYVSVRRLPKAISLRTGRLVTSSASGGSALQQRCGS